MGLESTTRKRLIQGISQPKATSSTASAAASGALAIGGTGFTVGVKIWLHDSSGANIICTSIVRVSATSLTAVCPAGALGVGYLRVQNRDGGMCTRPFTVTA